MIVFEAVGGYAALLFLAGMILIGYVFGKLAERIKLPEVTGFIIAGILLNHLFNDLLPLFNINVPFHEHVVSLEPVTTIALGFVSFLIGTKFYLPKVKEHIKVVLLTVLLQFVLVVCFTTALFWIFGLDLWMALLLAGVSSATAAVPIVELTKKYHSKGPLTNTINPVVAIDNVLGIAFFLIVAVFASSLRDQTSVVLADFVEPLIKIGLGIVVGALAGLLMIWLNKKVLCHYCDDEKYETYLVVSVGLVLFITLLTSAFGISPFITTIIMGAVFTNSLNKETFKYETSVINHFVPPLITAFFVIAGAELSVLDLFHYGGWAILYVVAHAGGKFLGAYLSTRIVKKTPENVKKYLPTSLFTQGGFEIFLAASVATLLLMDNDSEHAIFIRVVVLTSVLIFEFFAPLLMRRALFKSEEAREHLSTIVCKTD